MRAFVALSVGIAAGVFGFAVGAALTGAWLVALPIGMVVAGIVVLLGFRRPIVALEEGACSRGLKIVSALATLMALVQLVRLAVFMVDPSQVAYSAVPNSKWEVQHSCLSAYFVSARAASSATDVYDDSLFTTPDDVPSKPRTARMLGPFKIDVYEYPPPYLLLPRALLLLTPSFPHFRVLWFGLSGGVMLLAL